MKTKLAILPFAICALGYLAGCDSATVIPDEDRVIDSDFQISLSTSEPLQSALYNLSLAVDSTMYSTAEDTSGTE